jgi:hypothetical protein
MTNKLLIVTTGGFYKTKNGNIYCCFAVHKNIAHCISVDVGYKWTYTLTGKFNSWKDPEADFVEQVDPPKAD